MLKPTFSVPIPVRSRSRCCKAAMYCRPLSRNDRSHPVRGRTLENHASVGQRHRQSLGQCGRKLTGHVAQQIEDSSPAATSAVL